MTALLGISKDSWELFFGATQAIAVAFALGFGIYELREMRRQRAVASMEKMLEEWRRDTDCRDRVQRHMPLTDGSTVERAVSLAGVVTEARRLQGNADSGDLAETLIAARRTVQQLNDLGGFLDRRGVREVDFFSHFHVRIVELEFLLEPYFLLRSACRGNRWGLRLRRLAIGAARYHYAAAVHVGMAIRVRDRVVLEPGGPCRPRRSRKGFRYLPTKEECKPDDDSLIAQVQDALAAAGIDAGDVERAFGALGQRS